MRLILGAAGRARPGPERTLYEDYATRIARIGPSLGFSPLALREVAEGKDASELSRQDRAIAAARPEGFNLVVLDERGQSLSSVEFADRLVAWRDGGIPGVLFAIGGAEGLGAELRQAAELSLAFGAATWPHLLVRALLAEQIYRALTIIGRHPYHRA